MTDSFGARLRRQRERRQVSLADISARTKIKASLFEQLERDDVSRWPSGLFRRSFLRGYAEAIGVDPDATLREFLERFPDPESPHPPVLSAGTAPNPADDTGDRGATPLRLTLDDTGIAFRAGRMLTDNRRRWTAAAWDLGVLLAVAVTAFVVVGLFWKPFGIAAMCYYVGGILLAGNTPGVYLFGPGGARPQRTTPEPAPVPPRKVRGRPADARGHRTAVNPFRALRHPRTTRSGA